VGKGAWKAPLQLTNKVGGFLLLLHLHEWNLNLYQIYELNRLYGGPRTSEQLECAVATRETTETPNVRA
jgi:hypothetical protein